MNFKTLIAASVVAMVPAMASAVTIESIADGATTMIAQGGEADLYTFAVEVDNGSFSHTFELESDGKGTANVSLTPGIAAAFTGLVAEWLNAATGVVIATGTPDAGGDIAVSTTFVDPGSLVQILRISWDSTTLPKGSFFDGDVTVSTVPVPAGLLLMGTALAGLGMTRRKKA